MNHHLNSLTHLEAFLQVIRRGTERRKTPKPRIRTSAFPSCVLSPLPPPQACTHSPAPQRFGGEGTPSHSTLFAQILAEERREELEALQGGMEELRQEKALQSEAEERKLLDLRTRHRGRWHWGGDIEREICLTTFSPTIFGRSFSLRKCVQFDVTAKPRPLSLSHHSPLAVAAACLRKLIATEEASESAYTCLARGSPLTRIRV